MRLGFDRPLRVITLCSGYDSQCMALERLKKAFPGFDYELVAWSEIDRYAIQAHDAIFPQWAERNIGDMTKMDWSQVDGDIDLLVYSTPCTSIPTAGKQEGLKKGSGTASSILWSTEDAIRILRPKWLLMENVKNLVSKKFKADFDEWQRLVSTYGYTNCWKILNSKDYGVLQNRERVFLVSHLRDEFYHFPEPYPLERELCDILEDDVDESFYLSNEQIKKVFAYMDRKQAEGCGFKVNISNGGGVSTTIRAGYDRYYDSQMIMKRRKKRLLIDDYNGRIAENQECMGAVLPDCGNSAPRNGYKIMEYRIARIQGRNPENPSDRTKGSPTVQRLEIGGRISNTVTSVQKDNMVLRYEVQRKILSYSRDAKGKVVNRHLRTISGTVHTKEGSCGNTAMLAVETRLYQRKRGANKGGVHSLSPTIDSSAFADNNILMDGPNVRKLTPRECFRLMDVSDGDIDKIQAAGISKSQQYKMAGNSIVVAVLYHIFRKMFIDTGSDNEELELF